MEWQPWIIGALVVVGVGAYVRFNPTAKLKAVWVPKAMFLGELFSKWLVSKLPRKAAESIEEGIICTALDLIGSLLIGFKTGLLSDNQTRKGAKEDEPDTQNID